MIVQFFVFLYDHFFKNWKRSIPKRNTHLDLYNLHVLQIIINCEKQKSQKLVINCPNINGTILFIQGGIFVHYRFGDIFVHTRIEGGRIEDRTIFIHNRSSFSLHFITHFQFFLQIIFRGARGYSYITGEKMGVSVHNS